jgi:hypothetical protein
MLRKATEVEQVQLCRLLFEMGPRVRISLPPAVSLLRTGLSVPGAPTVPGFNYFAVWYVLALVAYLMIGIETRGRTIEELDAALGRPKPDRGSAGVVGYPHRLSVDFWSGRTERPLCDARPSFGPVN